MTRRRKMKIGVGIKLMMWKGRGIENRPFNMCNNQGS